MCNLPLKIIWQRFSCNNNLTFLFFVLFEFQYFSRGQVMSGREWCTLEEWLQCRRPLCPLVVRHDGRVEQPSDTSGNIRNATGEIGIRVCFASRRIGGSFLDDGASQVKKRK